VQVDGTPRLDVACRGFVIDGSMPAGSVARWWGRFSFEIALAMPLLTPWRRSAVELLAAVRSILADENASGVAGAWRVVFAGGDPLSKDGTGALLFDALVFGDNEI
jgi:hypothetical protein